VVEEAMKGPEGVEETVLPEVRTLSLRRRFG